MQTGTGDGEKLVTPYGSWTSMDSASSAREAANDSSKASSAVSADWSQLLARKVTIWRERYARVNCAAVRSVETNVRAQVIQEGVMTWDSK